MAKKISILNFKGGVAKTATALNLCTCLAMMGKKCLLIDLDTQHNSSKALGYAVGDGETVYDCLVDDSDHTPLPIYFYRPDEYKDCYDFVPASIQLRSASELLSTRLRKEDILKNHIADIEHHYDYIIIDCPPGDGILNVNAMSASDYIIAPTIADDDSLDGLDMMLARLSQIKEKKINTNVRLISILFTMAQKTHDIFKEAYDTTCKKYPGVVSKTIVPLDTKVKQASKKKEIAVQYAKWCNASLAYREYSKEIYNMLQNI